MNYQQLKFDGFEDDGNRVYKYDIYLSSSCLNHSLAETRNFLINTGYRIYDFRKNLIAWQEIFECEAMNHWKWGKFSTQVSKSDKVRSVLHRDMQAIQDSRALLMMLPCGNDSHMQMGYALGKGIPVIIFNPDGVFPCYDSLGNPGPWKPNLYYAATSLHISNIVDIVKILPLNKEI